MTKFKEPRNKKGNPKKYYNQYYNAYTCAKQRGIEWHFTYESWIEWWGDDIVKRGPYKGQLVMARNNDIGPYHPDNVYKSTSSDNCSIAVIRYRNDAEKEKQRVEAFKQTPWAQRGKLMEAA